MSVAHSCFRRTASSLVPAVAVLSAATARAQTEVRDSLPVHAGSYALEGGVGFSSSTFGALRFLSPRSAIGATLAAGYSHQSADNSTTISDNTTSYGSMTLSVGYRRYGAFRDRVAGFGTLGLTGGYSHQQQTESNYRFSTSSGNVGPFGELGAAYLVARRLTLNASAQAAITRSFSHQTNTGTGTESPSSSVHQNGFNANLGPVRIGLTLFL